MKLALIVACALASATAVAQTSETTRTRIRGTIERVDGPNLVVKTGTGQSVTVVMDPGFGISGVVRRELADIKPGDLVASTSVRQADGRLRALEVHFLPAGASQGQFPYDLAPNSLMTNAVVAGVTTAAEGRVLRVTYNGSTAEVLVPTDVPVVAFVPADVGLLHPGAAITLSATRKPDGTLTAARATVEKDGVKPPM